MKQLKIWNEDDIPYVASGFAKQLDKSKQSVITSDQDRVYVYDGREGVGKSTLAMQHAFYIDKNLVLDNIVFSSEDFKHKIRTLPKHSALIWDEAFKGLSSKSAISKENKKIVQLLQECRQRNLFIFIVLPTIFLLEKYPAIFRSTSLIHASFYRTNQKLRYYKVYNYRNKQLLYLLGKELYDYSRPHIYKSYRFYGKLPPTIDEKEYRKKKDDSFKELDDIPEENRPMKQRNALIHILHDQYGLKHKQIADKLQEKGVGMDRSMISKVLKGNVP